MFTAIRTLFLTILCFFLALPYGADAPTRSFIEDCSLKNNAVVCEQTENGLEATFTLNMKHEYRPIMSNRAFDDFDVKIFVADDDPELNKEIDNTIYYWPFLVIGEDEYYPPVIAQWSLAFENDPELIRVGDKYTVIVHLVLPDTTAPGTYSIAVSPNYAQECIFLNALIVN